MSRQVFILPDYSTTTDPQVLEDAWRALAEPIEAGTGYRLYAFGPDLVFTDDKYASFHVPVVLAMFIKKLSENQR